MGLSSGHCRDGDVSAIGFGHARLYERHDAKSLQSPKRYPCRPRRRAPRHGDISWAAGLREGNLLLASLPSEDWQRLQPLLEPITLLTADVLHDAGQMVTSAYFPTTAVVSLLNLTAGGASAEVAVVGNEGVVGIPLFMAGGSSPSCAMVQSAGGGFRAPARVIRDEFVRRGALTELLLRYTQALMAQIAQVAVCNRHHRLDQQLCRWLLFRMDRLPACEVAVTHELIAELLGVRREGVTVSLLALQRAGLIRYRRGYISVLDRLGLEARSCECYATVKREYHRLLLPGRIAAPPAAGMFA